MSADRKLTAAAFHQLAAVPPAAEWFADLDNPRTRRAYQTDLQDFMTFAGIARPEEFRLVTRAHVLAWRATLEARALAGAIIRRKLAALSSLFDYLCEKHAVDFNPVKGARRPQSWRGCTRGRARVLRQRPLTPLQSGNNNIRATYRKGLGTSGNLPAGRLTTLLAVEAWTFSRIQ
ncbi:site-specific integrase [Cupriavidus sp. CP313]